MPSFLKKVAIVGASGNMGKHTITELLKTDIQITALTRQGSNLSVPNGVSIKEVNYDDISSITTALEGQDFLMITLSVITPPGVHSNLVQAAAKAGIKYIMPNAYGFDFHNKALISDIDVASRFSKYSSEIEGLGMSHFSLVCSFWYEWSLGIGVLYGIDIREKKATFFDDGNTRINTSTWQQCGRAVAKILSLPIDGEGETLESWKNKSFYISSFRVNQREMLDSVHRVMGTEDKDWEISYEPTKKRYTQAVEDMKTGDRNAFAKAMYARVFFPDGSGDYESRRGLDNEILDLPTEELDEATKATVDLVESGWNPFGQ
ncbi:NAD(P)-binding protein [Aureobasidium pullulans]|uniref:NAD(P)-binding protein n=1 Tax=Aureobasidium pullulans TaxID=5580 RepID=A0A4S9VPB5_AURPU|nr:NAD(P)-binding protein [Aureobasidium pullulans]THX42661.1 NAD(P)-binding protein [Aureobasidium pullulans]THZ54109.1 NAD(P)-binding protein [Aureobasidium pullulans]